MLVINVFSVVIWLFTLFWRRVIVLLPWILLFFVTGVFQSLIKGVFHYWRPLGDLGTNIFVQVIRWRMRGISPYLFLFLLHVSRSAARYLRFLIRRMRELLKTGNVQIIWRKILLNRKLRFIMSLNMINPFYSHHFNTGPEIVYFGTTLRNI